MSRAPRPVYRLVQSSLILLAFIIRNCRLSEASTSCSSYGLGCSFPLKDGRFTCDDTMAGGVDQRLKVYNEYLYKGCFEAYGQDECMKEENFRLLKNSIKPMSMVNYTTKGYHKMKIPFRVMSLLQEHWHRHKNDPNISTEYINREKQILYANNYWKTPPHMTYLYSDGYNLSDTLLKEMHPIMEEFTGGIVEVRPTSVYGIRVYHRDTVIIPHVDWEPLILSAILNVDQDVDEDWPLEIIDRNGMAVNITMQPGEMVLYEGHSTIHGRPFPLKGNFYANAFVHFEPAAAIGQYQYQQQDSDSTNDKSFSLTDKPVTATDLPPYVIPGSLWEYHWRIENPHGWTYSNPLFFQNIPLKDAANVAATYANVAKLHELANSHNRELLFQHDPITGYAPIHQAVRSYGHIPSVQLLLVNGVDINMLTKDGTDTPLSLVLRVGQQINQTKFHPIVKFLIQHGAKTPEQLLLQAETAATYGNNHHPIKNQQQQQSRRKRIQRHYQRRRRRRRKNM